MKPAVRKLLALRRKNVVKSNRSSVKGTKDLQIWLFNTSKSWQGERKTVKSSAERKKRKREW